MRLATACAVFALFAAGCTKPVPAKLHGLYEAVCAMENDGKRYLVEGYPSLADRDVWLGRDRLIDLYVGAKPGERDAWLKAATGVMGELDDLPSTFTPDDLKVHLEEGGTAGPSARLLLTVKVGATEALFGPDKGKPVCTLRLVGARKLR